jgi:hypothetical protein
LSGVCGVDPTKDDHRDGGDAFEEHGHGLVIGDFEGQLRDAVGAEDADEHIRLGMWLRFSW